MPKNLKYILIMNPFGIGDVLFSTGLIEAIGRQVEGCHIGFLCNRRTEPLLRNNPMIDWIFVFDRDEYKRLWNHSKMEFAKAFLALLSDLKGKRFDTAIDLSLNRQYGFIAWLAGIRRRVGFNYKGRGTFLTDALSMDGYRDKHVVEHYLDLLKLLNLNPVANRLTLYVSDADRQWAKDFLVKNGIEDADLVVGLVPGGGASWGKDAHIKHWRITNFAELADRFVEEHKAKVIIFGSSVEEKICKVLKDNMRNTPISVCGKATLLQSAALMGMCGLVVANDGGLLHVASAMGVRTVGIFGPVDEKVYGQYPADGRHKAVTAEIECRPCYRNFRLRECDIRRCLDEITVQSVFKASEEVLKSSYGEKG